MYYIQTCFLIVHLLNKIPGNCQHFNLFANLYQPSPSVEWWVGGWNVDVSLFKQISKLPSNNLHSKYILATWFPSSKHREKTYWLTQKICVFLTREELAISEKQIFCRLFLGQDAIAIFRPLHPRNHWKRLPFWWILSVFEDVHGNLRVPPLCHPPPENKALLRDYWPLVSLRFPWDVDFFAGGFCLCCFCWDTVDGRNPKQPPGMYTTL